MAHNLISSAYFFLYSHSIRIMTVAWFTLTWKFFTNLTYCCCGDFPPLEAMTQHTRNIILRYSIRTFGSAFTNVCTSAKQQFAKVFFRQCKFFYDSPKFYSTNVLRYTVDLFSCRLPTLIDLL